MADRILPDGNQGAALFQSRRIALGPAGMQNVGHIFVVSKVLLAEYLTLVNDFFKSN